MIIGMKVKYIVKLKTLVWGKLILVFYKGSPFLRLFVSISYYLSF